MDRGGLAASAGVSANVRVCVRSVWRSDPFFDNSDDEARWEVEVLERIAEFLAAVFLTGGPSATTDVSGRPVCLNRKCDNPPRGKPRLDAHEVGLGCMR